MQDDKVKELVNKFLVDLFLLDIDSLICLRMSIKFSENTTDPFGPVNQTNDSFDNDG